MRECIWEILIISLYLLEILLSLSHPSSIIDWEARPDIMTSKNLASSPIHHFPLHSLLLCVLEIPSSFVPIRFLENRIDGEQR